MHRPHSNLIYDERHDGATIKTAFSILDIPTMGRRTLPIDSPVMGIGALCRSFSSASVRATFRNALYQEEIAS